MAATFHAVPARSATCQRVWRSGAAGRKARRYPAGFTVMELLIVVVVLGVLAAYAVSKSVTSGELTLRSQAQKLASDLRRAQFLASSWGQRLRVTATASSYSVSCTSAVVAPCPAATSMAITDPATASSFVVALQKGVVFVNPTTTTLDINSMGQALSGASYTLSAANGSSTASTVSLTVAPLTGFVAVTP